MTNEGRPAICSSGVFPAAPATAPDVFRGVFSRTPSMLISSMMTLRRSAFGPSMWKAIRPTSKALVMGASGSVTLSPSKVRPRGESDRSALSSSTLAPTMDVPAHSIVRSA